MAKNHEVGKRGEQLASDFLIKKGYKILETNWRHRRAEIDIIAMLDEVLIFIEVKTRTNNQFGRPESFVSERKRTLFYDASSKYMEEIGHEWEVRFDIISIFIHNEKYHTIDHFKDAFFN